MDQEKMTITDLEVLNKLHLAQDANKAMLEALLADKKKETESKTFTKNQWWAIIVGSSLIIISLFSNAIVSRFSGMKSASEVQSIEQRIHEEYRNKIQSKDYDSNFSNLNQALQNMANTVNNNTQATNSLQTTMNSNNQALNEKLNDMNKKYEELNAVIQKISERVDALEK